MSWTPNDKLHVSLFVYLKTCWYYVHFFSSLIFKCCEKINHFVTIIDVSLLVKSACKVYCLFFFPPTYVVRREGTVFPGVCLSTPGGQGGTPSKVGTPLQPDQGEGVPQGRYSPIQGRYPSPPPRPGQDGGEGVPQGWYPPSKVGTTQPGQDGGEGVPQNRYPPEHLLHGWRYASCVHAGGLSCNVVFSLKLWVIKSRRFETGWTQTHLNICLQHGHQFLLLLLADLYDCTFVEEVIIFKRW